MPALIRKLTTEENEIYAGAVIRAVDYVGSFRDAIAILRPYFDQTAETAYTDSYSRVGLSPWFFEELNTYQRASVILHETMHVLNNHFVRFENLPQYSKILNIAGDFEINCGLDKLPLVDLSFGVFPDKPPFNYPRYKTMEQYFQLLKEDKDKYDEEQEEKGQGSGKGAQSEDGEPGEGSGSEGASQSESGESNGSGNGESSGNPSSKSSAKGNSSSGSSQDKDKLEDSGSCDSPTEERSTSADDAGVAKASEAEQSIAKKNTAVRVSEELKKPRTPGTSHMHDFLSIAQLQMSPPKVSWQSIFRRVVSKSNDAIIRGRADYSYRRVNRRSHNSEFIFPGMVQYSPQVMFGIDTSGSMNSSDYNSLLSEVEGILKVCSKGKAPLSVFSVDTKIEGMKVVKNVKDVDLQGGGGTDMSRALSFVNTLHKKKSPDIFVLATDGFTNWDPYEIELREGSKLYRHILLITTHEGFKGVPESIIRMCPVIDIAPE